jgi:autotransporter-associated beta strand protein
MLLIFSAAFVATSTFAQFIPGQTYFGRSNYIEYIAGDLPFIVSAPHGGTLMPDELPDRTNCTTCGGWDFTTALDSNTDDLAVKIRTAFQNRFGHVPHVIICHLSRVKIDCNRPIDEGAQGNPNTQQAWNEFQNFIIAAKSNIVSQFGKGFYIDLHGQGHAIQRLELGYLLSSSQLGLSDSTLNTTTSYENQSSIRTLSQQSPLSFAALLRGANSFGGLMEAQGYPCVPSPSTPNPGGDPYFDGGYNTKTHGSSTGGVIDALQIESNYTGVRDSSAHRTAFAASLAEVMDEFFAIHYAMNLRTCSPAIWNSGSGYWTNADSWANGAIPVSSNNIVFSGSGGTVRNNLLALTTGNGVIGSILFTNSVTGSYTLSDNPFTLLGGITNNSSFNQTINNHITLNNSAIVSANSNSMAFAGNITNLGSTLTFNGSSTQSVSGAIIGNGGIIKSGAGALTLSGSNLYHGSTTLNGGLLQISSTATLGDGTGTLNLFNGILALSATRDTTLRVIANPIFLIGNCIIQNTTTAASGTRNFPFGSDTVLMAGGSLTIRNIAVANINTMNVRFQGSGFDFSRPIIFDNSLAAGPFSNSVQLDFYNTNGVQTFSGVISGNGKLRRGSLSSGIEATTILTGSNSYSGGTTINQGKLMVNNISGSGTGSGEVVVNSGGTIGGNGTIFGAVSCAGMITPGSEVGALTIGGGLDLSGGGVYEWELADFSTAESQNHFDQILLTGGNLVLDGTANLTLRFVGSASEPDSSNTFWKEVHTWKIIGLSDSATNIGFTRFATISNSVFGAGTFTNLVDVTGNIWLKFIPTGANAQPTILPLLADNGVKRLALSWDAVIGQSYEVQVADDLYPPNWIPLQTLTAETNVVSFTNLTDVPFQRFYRVVIH